MKCDMCGIKTDTLWLSALWIRNHEGRLVDYGMPDENAKPIKKPYLCDFCFDSEIKRYPEGF